MRNVNGEIKEIKETSRWPDMPKFVKPGVYIFPHKPFAYLRK
jgi:hypothetical protein